MYEVHTHVDSGMADEESGERGEAAEGEEAGKMSVGSRPLKFSSETKGSLWTPPSEGGSPVTSQRRETV